MAESYELRVTELSEIEALELQNAIDDNVRAANPIEVTSEPLPSEGMSGDPGLVQAFMTYAPEAIPALAAALAAWIVAGRKRRTLSGVKFSIGWGGINYSNIELKELEQTSSGDALKTTLSHLLQNVGGGPAEPKAG
jgi:hypothetical protein